MSARWISQLAQATGFTGPIIRYYERIGLLPAPDRTSSGYRCPACGCPPDVQEASPRI